MNWWQQMPWIIAACALVIGPFIAGMANLLIRRVETMNERANLIADLELLEKFPGYSAAPKIRWILEKRLSSYAMALDIRHIERAPLTRLQMAIVGLPGFIAAVAAGTAVLQASRQIAGVSSRNAWPSVGMMLVVAAAELAVALAFKRSMGRRNGIAAEFERRREVLRLAREENGDDESSQPLDDYFNTLPDLGNDSAA